MLLELDVRLQSRPTHRQAAGLHEFWRPLKGEHVEPADRLALRVAFADGRAVTLVDLKSGFWSVELEERYADPAEPVLRLGPAGSGSRPGHGQATELWLGPMPPEGPVVFGCAWPSLGVPACEAVLDGGELARAGSAAEVLWPLVEDMTPEQLGVRFTGGYMPLKPVD